MVAALDVEKRVTLGATLIITKQLEDFISKNTVSFLLALPVFHSIS